MASFVLLLLVGGISSGYQAEFGSNCCDSTSSCVNLAKSKDKSQCDAGHSHYNNYCVPKCPMGYYSNSGNCEKCHTPCTSCVKEKCVSCTDNRYLSKGGFCNSVCSDKLYVRKNSNSQRVRLVQGRSSLEGVVEVYYDGSWGTICANGWNGSAAKVLCKELKLGNFVEGKIVGQNRFRRSDGYKDAKIWLSGVRCTGKEKSILQCKHEPWGENKCSHLEDVGVRCRGPDMTKTCEASCGDGYFDSGDKKCSECPLDCKTCSSLDKCTSCIEKRFLEGGSCVASCKPGTYGDRKTLKCTACPDTCELCKETVEGPKCTSCLPEKQNNIISGQECVEDCRGSAVRSKYLRLSGNYSSPYMGLLEVKYEGAWHTVCDDSFTLNTARVFCRELGYGQPIKYSGALYGVGSGKIIARHVDCKGDEVSFVDCRQMDWFPGGCSHREDIGLWCQPPTDHDILTNKCIEKCVPGFFEGKNKICELCNRKCLTCTGRPDNCLTCRNPYFHNGTTCALTCPDGTYPNTTLRVCRPCNAECGTCGGREDNCLSCVRPLLHNGSHCGKKCPAGVYRKEYSCVRDCGLRHYPNHKDKVCHACRLGCLVCSEYSKCTACEHGFVLTNQGTCEQSCTSGQFWTPVDPKSVGVDLSLRLSSVENFRYKGRLEIKHEGVWGTICDDFWDRKSAEVACRQLLFGPPVKINYLRSKSFKELNISKMWLDDVVCEGTEERIEDCKAKEWGQNNCVHSEDVHIECARPGISSCESKCPPAFHINGTNCLPCPVNCLNCSSPNNCSLCVKGYFRNGTICTKKCPPGFYEAADGEDRQCMPCHQECQTCTGPSTTHCSSCDEPRLLQGDMCVLSCSDGFYKREHNPNIELWRKKGPYEGVVRITLKGRQGFVCDRYLRFEQGQVVCRELKMGTATEVYQSSMYSYYSTPKLINNPICVGNESSIFDCPPRGIAYCTVRSIMSVKCSGPDKSRKCLRKEECTGEKNFFISYVNKTCGRCSRECLQCEKDASRCTACPEGYFLTWDNKCVEYCREGTFFSIYSKRCEKCNLDKCVACHNNKDVCTVCSGGKYLGQGGCRDDCRPDNSRIGSDQLRLARYPLTALTFGTNNTRGIVETFVEGDWVPVCFYDFSIQAAAVVCHQLGLGDPVGVFRYTQYVLRHPVEKLPRYKCSGKEKKLSDCTTVGQCPFYRLAGVTCSRSTMNKQCVKQCGPGFYLADKECRLCSKNCTTCVGTATNCTSCNNTNVLHNSKCMEACPDGYFIHLGHKRCERCNEMCKTCHNGWSNDRCTSCNKPYYLRDTSCVETCYPDYTLEELMQEDKSPNVRLINGSTNHEGFIQVKIDDDGWKLVCARDTFIITLVCQELGFQGGQLIRYDVFSDLTVRKLSGSCRGYEKSLKDCNLNRAFWCPRQPFIACSNKRIDKRVCRKENDAPCALGVCSEKATCVDGDGKVIPKGHSYCKYCPLNSYGDGYNCTVISKVPPTVRQAYVQRKYQYGLRYYMQCYARSERDYIYPDRFGWFKDGKRMKIASGSRTMTIGPMHYQDTGIYTCIMKNSVGSVNVTYNVTVYGKPEIRRADNIDIIHNNSALLTCDVLAHPPATISWHLGNITFNETSTRDDGPRVLGNGSLYIPQPIAKDTGNYSCIAGNAYGVTSQNVRLRIGEELRFEKKASSVTVAKGEKAELKCQPFSSDKRMSKWWRRNGETLKFNSDGPLTINDVSSNDCGEYYCVAKDGESIITSIGTLSIKDEPPCMHTPPKNLELEDGMYARFYCAASGDPVPTIYWQDKVQEPIPNVFEIKEVNISHVGIYKCTARSGKKSKDSYAFLSVNGHHPCPLIFEKPKDTAAIFGQEATFFCDGVANLNPNFKWYKGNYKLQDGDKYKLTNNNRKLTIKNVNEDDLGKYKCTLSGQYGYTSAEASLASVTAGALKGNSPSTAGIVVGVLICILVIIIVLYFVHRYRRNGSTPVDVMKDVKRKTFYRFQSRTSHTVLKDASLEYHVQDDDEYDTSDTNPFVRD